MPLVPKISLSLGNKCNKVTITEETGIYTTGTNEGGWGTPNIDTTDVTASVVNIYPYYYTPAQNASCIGGIIGTTFTDVTHTVGKFMVGQTLIGAGIVPGTKIIAVITGTGDNDGGTYLINNPQVIAPTTVITGLSLETSFSIIGTYATAPYSPTPVPYTAISEANWTLPDGIFQIEYKVSTETDTYTNETQHELFLCNLCNCKDSLVVKLIDACDSLEVKKLKEQVDQMEIFIYGIQSAFSCGDFDTADNILTAATTYCTTMSNCGCGCGDCK